MVSDETREILNRLKSAAAELERTAAEVIEAREAERHGIIHD